MNDKTMVKKLGWCRTSRHRAILVLPKNASDKCQHRRLSDEIEGCCKRCKKQNHFFSVHQKLTRMTANIWNVPPWIFLSFFLIYVGLKQLTSSGLGFEMQFSFFALELKLIFLVRHSNWEKSRLISFDKLRKMLLALEKSGWWYPVGLPGFKDCQLSR